MVKIEIEFNQIKKAAQMLSLKQRLQLIEALQQSGWQNQFKALLARIDERRKKHPISDEEIDRIVEEAREEYHAKHRRD